MHEVRFMSCFRSLFSLDRAHKKFICINKALLELDKSPFVDVFMPFHFHSPCGSPSFLSLPIQAENSKAISVALHDKTRFLKSSASVERETTSIPLPDRVIINLAVFNFNLIKKRFKASRFLAKTKLKTQKRRSRRRKKKSEKKMKLIFL